MRSTALLLLALAVIRVQSDVDILLQSADWKEHHPQNLHDPVKNDYGEWIDLPIDESEFDYDSTNPNDSNPTVKLRTGRYGEYMGPSRGSEQTPPTIMDAVAVPTLSYEPSTSVNAAFAAFIPDHHTPPGYSKGIMVADCDLTVKKPTINLANYIDVSKITCSKTSITVTFNKIASTLQAHKEWSNSPGDFAAMIPGRARCNGKNELQMRLVSSVRMPNSVAPKLILMARHAKIEDLIHEYDISFKHLSVSDKPRNDNGTTKQKRSTSLIRNSGWAFGANWDDVKKTVTRPTINIISMNNFGIKCDECYISGLSQFALRVAGTAFALTKYKFAMDGALKGSMSMVSEVKVPVSSKFQVTLFTIPLSPMSIPGLLSFGPELQFNAAVQVAMTGKVQVKSGLEVDFPQKLDVNSKETIMSQPSVESSEDSGRKVSMHPLKVSSKQPLQVVLHLIPRFQFGLSILSASPFSLGLDFDSSIGVSATIKEIVKDSDRVRDHFSIEAYHEHCLTMGILSFDLTKAWEILNPKATPIEDAQFDISSPKESEKSPDTNTSTERRVPTFKPDFGVSQLPGNKDHNVSTQKVHSNEPRNLIDSAKQESLDLMEKWDKLWFGKSVLDNVPAITVS